MSLPKPKSSPLILTGGRATSFIAGLKYEELQLLRKVVREVYLKRIAFGQQEHMTDFECDRVIESKGPEVAERLVRRAVKSEFERTGKLLNFS
jgi:hypothetical protein